MTKLAAAYSCEYRNQHLIGESSVRFARVTPEAPCLSSPDRGLTAPQSPSN